MAPAVGIRRGYRLVAGDHDRAFPAEKFIELGIRSRVELARRVAAAGADLTPRAVPS